jgi:hypothetical protein
MVVSAAFVVPLFRRVVLDVYSNSYAGNVKIAFLCLAFIYSVREIVTWFERRNQLAFVLGSAGIWTEKTGWLTWSETKFKIDVWQNTMSFAYQKESSPRLLRWSLSALDSSRAQLLKTCQEYKAIVE